MWILNDLENSLKLAIFLEKNLPENVFYEKKMEFTMTQLTENITKIKVQWVVTVRSLQKEQI